MAPSDPLLPFFSRMADLNGIIVKDPPKFDLDLYIQNYTGRTRFERLLCIGKCSVPLCVEALKAAVAEAKAGTDVSRYLEAWDCIRLAAPQEPEAEKDDEWIKNTERHVRQLAHKMEIELKTARNNLIKETIRLAHQELGKHYEAAGLLNEASEAYAKLRQDMGASVHLVECGLHLVSVAIQRRDWQQVLSHLGKIVGILESTDSGLKACTKVVSGIALLNLGNYQDAAVQFIQIESTVPAAIYNRFISPNDIAIYGGLLALATLTRDELRTRVLDNVSFRQFLEQEPHIRKAISNFVTGNYSNCLAMLISAKNDFLLDIYLQSHVPEIYSRIRNRCIVQCCLPFSCLTIKSLEQALGGPWEDLELEDELVVLIQAGSVKCRIDSKNKVLLAVQPNARQHMQTSALETARLYEQEAKERLRRINLISAGLEVAGHKKGQTWSTDPYLEDAPTALDL